MSDHSFQDSYDREVNVTIIESHGYDDQVYMPDEVNEHLDETDRIFYSIEDSDGESFFRWVAGPFESEADLYTAIEEEFSIYED